MYAGNKFQQQGHGTTNRYQRQSLEKGRDSLLLGRDRINVEWEGMVKDWRSPSPVRLHIPSPAQAIISRVEALSVCYMPLGLATTEAIGVANAAMSNTLAKCIVDPRI